MGTQVESERTDDSLEALAGDKTHEELEIMPGRLKALLRTFHQSQNILTCSSTMETLVTI